MDLLDVILDKFIREADKRVELEHAQVGDDSALYIIILDEMGDIPRKSGSTSIDATGAQDSVQVTPYLKEKLDALYTLLPQLHGQTQHVSLCMRFLSRQS